MYTRQKGCVSSARAQDALAERGLVPLTVTDARKEKLGGEAAWELLSSAREILIASGKKVLRFDPAQDNRDEILAKALGRTGNLRAPVLRVGDRLLVGFNEQLYQQELFDAPVP
ncbi:MAG: ArsC family (seleno)protein [Desulfobulbus sp.]